MHPLLRSSALALTVTLVPHGAEGGSPKKDPKAALIEELGLPEDATWFDVRRSWGHLTVGHVKDVLGVPRGAPLQALANRIAEIEAAEQE